MKTILPLNGAINKDVNPLYVDAAKGEVIHRKNCRVASSDGGRQGINVSIKGMTEVSAGLPSGTNRIIGYVEDTEREQGIFFNYNNNGDHGIYAFNGSNVINMGAVSSALGFTATEVIDATILGDYCVFVSDFNPPRKIRVWNSDTDTQTSLAGKDAFDIQLAVRPPSTKPATVLGSDATKVVNKLVGKTFQFAYFYIYNDYTYSVLSPYSDIVVSSAVFDAKDNTYIDNAVGNYVQVEYGLGNDEVRTVKLIAREGNSGNWFVVEEYDTGGSGGTRTYSFFNDVARQGLVETEALALYSDVPLLAKTVETVENRIVLGNVLKGYDKTSPIVEYAVEYEDVDVSGSSNALNVNSGIDDPGDPTGDYYVEFEIPSPPVADTVISVSLSGRYEQFIGAASYRFRWRYEFSYTVNAGDSLVDVQNAFIYDINTKGISIIETDYGTYVAGSGYLVYGSTGLTSNYVAISFTPVWDDSGDDGEGGGAGSYVDILVSTASEETLPTGVSTFKGGSYYNVGVLFYDDFSRTSGVLSSQSVYVPHAGERAFADAFDRARIAFTIPDGSVGVPSWATKYRFAVTESVNFTGVFPFVSGDTDDVKQLWLDGQKVLAINMPTNLQYEFTKGDYLHFEVLDDPATPTDITKTIVKNIIGTRTLLTIGSTEYSGFWLIVPAGTEIVADYTDALMYIYRLKNTVEDLVYFEDSNTYDITGGVMQTLSGYVGGEDAWYVEREFEWDTVIGSITKVVEDFYINVDDAIRAYSKGRAVVEFDTLGQIRLQDVVWSFNYLDNTKINGISTFNSLNRKQLDEKSGEIQRIRLVGDVIKVIQVDKETSLYVGKAQISDARGNLQVVKSNDFIGTVYPSQTDYGSSYPQSIVRYNRNLYYWDNDHGEVVRSSPNGIHPISEYGMKSEFLRIKDDIDDALLVDSSSVDIIALYDIRNDEYVITFDIRGAVETWVFKEGADGWTQEIDWTKSDNSADLYGNLAEQSLSFGFDSVWKHEDNSSYNSFYGESKIASVKGVVNVEPREEKCLRALEMDSNRAFNTIITTPVTVTNTLGQKTYLYPGTYRERDGSFTSAVFKNILIVGGEDINQIHANNDIVGKYIEIELNDNGVTEAQLRLVTASFTINK